MKYWAKASETYGDGDGGCWRRWRNDMVRRFGKGALYSLKGDGLVKETGLRPT